MKFFFDLFLFTTFHDIHNIHHIMTNVVFLHKKSIIKCNKTAEITQSKQKARIAPNPNCEVCERKKFEKRN